MKRTNVIGPFILGLVIALILIVGTGQGADCKRTSVGIIPLTDLGDGLYQGYAGGLYPGGSNERPADHETLGLHLAQSVVPLDRQGNGDPADGRIVLLSIGMSNTTQEFSTFKTMADQDPDRNPMLVLVDGAQGGMTAFRIMDPEDGGSGTQFWTTVDQRLAKAGVTRRQVQVAWVKEADAAPTAGFPDYALTLHEELAVISQVLKNRFPNIQLAYYSSRIYGGYADRPLNPESYAYESGFSVKWLIERQITGDEALALDRAPWLAWGPYLWADGLVERGDGLIWQCNEFQADGTHPSLLGRRKVARMLLDFFKIDSTTTPWFLRRER